MIAAVKHLSHRVSKRAACEALVVSRATFYRHQRRRITDKDRPAPPLALEPDERQQVIDILHSDRFLDDTPYEIFATLLDEGQYYCSIRTMYRILVKEHGHVKERRKHVQRSNYVKPELLATAPNQVWSWDISVPQQAA
jgi:putative transposase